MNSKTPLQTFGFLSFVYLILLIINISFAIVLFLLLISRCGLIVVDLSSAKKLSTLGWPFVLIQFLFSLLSSIGTLKYFLIRLDFHSYKEETSATIDFLRNKLREYEPPEEAEYAD